MSFRISLIRNLSATLLAFVLGHSAAAQTTIHVPGGTVGNISGNDVGIGTASPVSKLEIVSAVPFLTITGGTNAALRGLAIRDGSTTIATFQARADSGELQISAGLSEWGGFQTFHTNGAERLRIATSGNVGIGTTTPSRPLAVVGAGVDEVGGTFRGVASFFNSTSGKGLYVGYDNAEQLASLLPQGANSGISFWSHNGSWGERMRIATNGNIGIGTTSPSHKLSVNGTIRAKEVIVDTGWSDYVFADDYHLAPLSEVEAHIKVRKHLPGIPSAAEVEAGGVSLGDMQARLLAKVEELTLHVIAQEKRMQRLESENHDLRSQLTALSSKP